MEKKYEFIGVRPVGNTSRRLRAVVRAAKTKGERKSLSSLVNECLSAHLPKLEEKYLTKEAS